jgi:DNA (cytosine-5)-methyltransferase 1
MGEEYEMKYLSVCSGIDSATVAWHPLGWEAVAYSEIEPFPCKVLAHHYPNTPNLGDMTKFKEWTDYANVDVLVGGTPCQSFSIAGLRKGLDDPRGNLMLTYLAIADKYRPTWLVWENVPGVLSSNGGKDFGTFLGGLGQLGYGFAYRVLDAQYVRTDGYPHAVPQRRRRVFVVGHLGSWQRAAAVLFDTESLRGNPPPRREAGKTVAGTIGTRTGTSIGAQDAACGHMLPVAPTLDAHYGDKMGLDNQHINAGGGCSSISKTLITKTRLDAEMETLIPTIGGGFDVPTFALAGNTIGRQPENGGNGTGFDDSGSCYTLTKTDQHAIATSAHAFKVRGGCDGGGKGYLGSDETAFTLSTTHDQDVAVARSLTARADGSPCADRGPNIISSAMQVRRLTPLECERLQGFPDDYTNIPGASDTTRYKALGNSMACNVMQLIGQRIQMVNEIPLSMEAAA